MSRASIVVLSLAELRRRLVERDDDPESWVYVERLIHQRDEARYNARVLSHCYRTDSTPPQDVIARCDEYPVWGAGTAKGEPL